MTHQWKDGETVANFLYYDEAGRIIGEVGLAGEVRQVGHLARRLNEASRLGFTQAIVPASAPDIQSGCTIRRASTLNEALALAGFTTNG